MQSFTFRELSLDAQANAMARYSEDQSIVELVADLMEQAHEAGRNIDTYRPTTEEIFFYANWRYTEHGERVA